MGGRRKPGSPGPTGRRRRRGPRPDPARPGTPSLRQAARVGVHRAAEPLVVSQSLLAEAGAFRRAPHLLREGPEGSRPHPGPGCHPRRAGRPAIVRAPPLLNIHAGGRARARAGFHPLSRRRGRGSRSPLLSGAGRCPASPPPPPPPAASLSRGLALARSLAALSGPSSGRLVQARARGAPGPEAAGDARGVGGGRGRAAAPWCEPRGPRSPRSAQTRGHAAPAAACLCGPSPGAAEPLPVARSLARSWGGDPGKMANDSPAKSLVDIDLSSLRVSAAAPCAPRWTRTPAGAAAPLSAGRARGLEGG